MTRIAWDALGSRLYEVGIDRAVLYVGSQPGVPWNGITSVSESSSGGNQTPYYLDGDKYLNLSSPEEYEASLTAYTYPDEFMACDGTAAVRQGLLATRQKRKPFGLSYRTKVGSDLNEDLAYKIHIVYNVTAAPASRSYKSMGGGVDPNDFNWKLTAVPAVTAGYRKTAHIILDSRTMDPVVLSAAEDILYGTDSTLSRLPSFAELVDLIDTNATLTVVDNGDGTFTVTAPMSDLAMIDSSNFEITWPTVSVSGDTFTVSSP